MIAHALEKDLLLKDMTDSSFIRQALAQKDGILAYDWKGEHKYMGIARVASTGWLVCMTAYESEMTATAIDQRNTLIIIGILAIIAVVGSIILANRALVLRPLLAVERFTQAITAGDLRAKLSGVFRFELADLAANLRAMYIPNPVSTKTSKKMTTKRHCIETSPREFFAHHLRG